MAYLLEYTVFPRILDDHVLCPFPAPIAPDIEGIFPKSLLSELSFSSTNLHLQTAL
jgi:hypothetical protein